MIPASPRLCAVLVSVILCGVALNMVIAAAAADPIESGITKVTLAKPFNDQLNADRIGIQTIKSRASKVRVLTWPIVDGSLTPPGARGYLRYHAAIRFHSGSRQVLLRGLLLDTSHGVLRGSLDARSLTIASADIRAIHRQGFAIAFSSDLRLRPETARILNARLRSDHRFHPGQRLGHVATLARPETVSVTGGSLVELAIAESFKAKLDSLGVGLRPYEDAVQSSLTPNAFSLPLLPQGAISPDFTRGGVFSEDGIQFNRDEGPFPRQVEFFATSLSLESGLLLGGIQGQGHQIFGSVPLAALDLTHASRQADPLSDVLALSGVTASLGPDLAAALNETYVAPDQPPTFTAGEPFAIIALSVRTG